MRTKRVLLLKSGAARPGGLEKITVRLAQAFQEKGCEVLLATTGEKTPPIFKTFSHTSRHLFSFQKALAFDRFCEKTARELQPEIIFGMDRNRHQTHLRAGNGVHAAYLERRALVDPLFKRLSFSLNPLHRTLLKLEKQGFENPALRTLFTNSAMVKEEILRYYKVAPEKICVVHNGVEWNEYDSAFRSWEERKKQIATELELDPSLFHFLFIGHNFRRKGVDNLLAALPLLPRRFHLSIVGEDKNRAQFVARAKELGVEKNVTFFGTQNDIVPFYQLADALVIPSLYDPFANVTLEALAMGLFIVSSKTNGGHEVLSEKSGVVIDALADPDSVASALKRAMHHPKTQMSAEKIRQSVQHLDFSKKLQEIVDRCLL